MPPASRRCVTSGIHADCRGVGECSRRRAAVLCAKSNEGAGSLRATVERRHTRRMATDFDEEQQRVEAEERDLVFARFTNDDALELGLLLAEKARARELPIAIDIERGGQRLFHFAAAGTAPDNASWIERKKNLVRRMFRSSYGVGLKLAASNKTLEDNMGPAAAEYAAHGGCFPIVVRGVGTVTVSGLPQKEDHDLVVEAIREFLARAPAG